jgi:trehalose 6-phosphate phosphatase
MSTPPPQRLPLDRTALFLDFDGTLVEIAPRADAVAVPKDLPGLLQRLEGALGGALATVSGRPIDDIDRMLAPARFAAGGAHGAELRASGGEAVQRIGKSLPEGLHAHLASFLAAWRKRWPGVYAEDKGVAFAIHFRQAPEAETPIADALSAMDMGNDWKIMRGHCVFEIKSALLSKGSVVRSLMQAKAFLGRRPVFIGDDRTDLDGMTAAVELGGMGIAVGDLKAKQAKWRLPDPAAVRDWLQGVAAA